MLQQVFCIVSAIPTTNSFCVGITCASYPRHSCARIWVACVPTCGAGFDDPCSHKSRGSCVASQLCSWVWTSWILQPCTCDLPFLLCGFHLSVAYPHWVLACGHPIGSCRRSSPRLDAWTTSSLWIVWNELRRPHRPQMMSRFALPCLPCTLCDMHGEFVI